MDRQRGREADRRWTARGQRLIALLGLGLLAQPVAAQPVEAQPQAQALRSTVTAKGARQFIESIQALLQERMAQAERAAWVASNFITEDTQAIEALAHERLMEANAQAITQAAQFRGIKLEPDERRKLERLRLASSAPAPSDAQARKDFARVLSDMGAFYGSGRWCPPEVSRDDARCETLQQLSERLAQSREVGPLRDAWRHWHDLFGPMRADYARFVRLGNEGAQAIGFKDLGDLWRSGYDMPPEAFEAEVERLWQTVRPLYEQLHCYARARLAERYPGEVTAQGTIPAHVLGNMWAQEWSEIFDLLKPYPDAPSFDVTAALKAQQWDAVRMVKQAESFFTGLGLKALPPSFYERSLFVRPRDRDVECHASAWDVDYRGDVRIKMCIEPTEGDLITIHHELGHIYYYMYYGHQPILYQDGAHDGFHEAIGDALALSVTPGYLQSVGLQMTPTAQKNTAQAAASGVKKDAAGQEIDPVLINEQLKVALDKIAFLPFGRMIDQWRWDVFSGAVPEAQWNDHWWQLRQKYQGVHAPVERPAGAFDPGAKYHIPGNTPYIRYFLSFIIQFQFYEALCEAAGHTGPLHTCSFAGSAAAGERLAKVLSMGASEPWPEAMRAFTGQPKMEAQALMRYFEPLQAWLAQENEGRACGW